MQTEHEFRPPQGDFVAYVQLARIPGIGPKRLRTCLAQVDGDAAAALADLALLMPGQHLGPCMTRDQAEDEIANHERIGALLIGWGDPLYPHLLEEISDAPPLLSVRGKQEIWSQVLTRYPRTFGIVGARQASLNAQRLAGLWAQQAAARGWVIISGLARGVDAAAHAGALAASDILLDDHTQDTPQPGATIAVSGCGVDVCYPAENRTLFDQMATEQIVISEHALGQGPVAQHFPRRNRLISALSRGVLVVEAGLRSGSLITARCALEQNREVFVVPGFPLDPRYHGSNWLISEGAHLAQNIEGILEHLRGLERARGGKVVRRPSAPPRATDAPARTIPDVHHTDAAACHVLSLLGDAPTAYDDLWMVLSAQEGGGWTVPGLSMCLQSLEFQGLIQRHPGSTYSKLN